MQPSLRRLFNAVRIAPRGLLLAAALAAATCPIIGCNPSGFALAFRDFDSSAIEGIRLWKFNARRRVWREELVLEFGESVERGGVEFLLYTAPLGRNGAGIDLFTKLERFDNGNVVKLKFGMLQLAPGDYKISAFNEAGDSPLSTGTYSLALNAS